MKRALLGTFWIGAVAAAIAIGLQLSGLLAPPSAALARALRISPNGAATFENFVIALGLSFAVAWTMLQAISLGRQLLLLVLLLLEILGAAWLLHAFGISFFDPAPALVAALLATVLALALHASASGRRRRAALRAFAGRLGQEGIDRLTIAPLDLSQPGAHAASCVFCEIANEAELIDDLPPAACAELTREFIASASQSFLESGGYLHGVDGEGVRIVFGFPNQSPQHAVAAARAALAFRDHFRAAAAARPESLGKIDLRLGVSSGTLVAAPGSAAPNEIVLAGEPIEIARRLARANQVYGSEILLDPRSFHAAGKAIVARPIDFLRSAAAHDRLEVYELLALAEEASPEVIARRDQFWTAIVYYRERRWNEAFAEFLRAKGDDGAADGPLQWYLRRLEPVCLKMAPEPSPVAEPLVPI